MLLCSTWPIAIEYELELLVPAPNTTPNRSVLLRPRPNRMVLCPFEPTEAHAALAQQAGL